MKKKIFSWLAMFCFMIPCVLGLSACGKEPAAMTGYKIIVNQQLIAESRTINVTYGDEIEWSAIALYDDSTISAIAATDITVTDVEEVVGTTPIVGQYEVKFKYLEFGEYTVTLNVNPKQLEIPTATNLVYNGEEQTTTLTGFDVNTMTVEGSLTATTANTYSVEVSLKDTTNYCWVDGSTSSQTVEFLVAKAKIAKPTKVDTTYTYTGSPITLELNGFDADSMSIIGNVETNAGDYIAVVTLEDTTNYEWKNAASSEIEWTIEKAAGTAPTTAPTALSGTYDPSKTLADYSVASGYKWVDDTIEPTVPVTEYAVIYNPDPANYTDFEMNYPLNLQRAELVLPTVDGVAPGYDGTAKTVVLAHFNEDLMSVSGNTEIEVGSHTATVTVTNPNYAFPGDETEATIAWSIDKGTPTITIPYNYSKPYDGLRVNLPRYEMPALLEEEALAISNGLSIGYFDLELEPIAFENVTEAGTYKLVISTAATEHYYAASAEQEFQIYYSLEYEQNNQNLEVLVQADPLIFDNTEKEPIFTIKRNPGDPEEETLTLGTDYTVEYFNNVKWDDDSYAIITGVGKYAGTIKRLFEISLDHTQLLNSVTVNSKPVQFGFEYDPENHPGSTVNVVYINRTGETFEVVLNVADLYESDFAAKGNFSYNAQGVNYQYYGYDVDISNDTLKFSVSNEASSVYLFYNGYPVANFAVWDEDANSNYISLSGGTHCGYYGDLNWWNIDLQAEGTVEEIITDTIKNNASGQNDYYIEKETLEVAANGKTFTVDVNNGETTKTLKYNIYDKREKPLQILKVELEDENGEDYRLEFDSNKTLEIEEVESDMWLTITTNVPDRYLYAYEVYLGGNKIQDSSTEQGGITGIRTNKFTAAGTYTIKMFTTETDFVEYTVVVESFVDIEEDEESIEEYISVTYNGTKYAFVQTFDGGINVKLDAAAGMPQYFFIYAGNLSGGEESITVAIEIVGAGLSDAEGNPFADPSNATLEVMTGADGVQYAMFYCGIEGNMYPLYIYFTDAPVGDVEFKFANTTLTFNDEYTKGEFDGEDAWWFGDFFALSDPAEAPSESGAKIIGLGAMVNASELGFIAMQVGDDDDTMYIYDTTVGVEIELLNMMSMVIYGADLGPDANVVSLMMPVLPQIKLPVKFDEEAGMATITFMVTDISFMLEAEPDVDPVDEPAEEPGDMPVQEMVIYAVTLFIV